MRMSQLFGQTLREAPADVEVESHRLLVRSGCIRQLGAGIFSYLPLGWRVVGKIQTIIRQEMERIGAQELLMPVVNTADIWKDSGRWDVIGPELTRFKDRQDRDLVLAMTHEEAVSDLVRQEIRSYRQLPRLIYHLQTKWRDDPRPRAGLIRVREFIMKDSYSLDRDDAGLDLQYDRHYQAYHRVFSRCGLDALAVKSDVGMMGGKVAHEFMYLTPIGEDTIMICASCGFRANRQVAAFRRDEPDAGAPAEQQLPVEEVSTPGTTSIEDLTKLLAVPASRTAKAVVMVGQVNDEETRLVFAVIRGDLEVNETKLANAAGVRALRPATSEEIAAVGAVPGYASPVGIDGVSVLADLSIATTPNLVAGANRQGYHLRNVNYGRDFTASVVTDIAAAQEGSPCPDCGAPLAARRGVELGNIFKLGTRYSDSMGCFFLDEDGERKPVIMGSYGIGVGRLLASIAEEYNDKDGLLWPVSVAPYTAHLIVINGAESEAERLYDELEGAGIDTLYDDRDERPGVKFKDADLIGIPIRITVSPRSIEQGGAETKLRHESDRGSVAIDQAVEWARSTATLLEQPLGERADTAPARAD
ncbi:MAG: proline--tRNA ligase [Spirochaetaceae bacterium]|nr:MAG: proline--tRNA ligase [Spirochaetaceae bacterium]